MKTALVCGAGGFIGHHLVKRLKNDGYYVRGVDIKRPEFSKTMADQFMVLDLRDKKNCEKALTIEKGFDEVYQLAADMGGMGFIHSQESEIMYNSALINLNMANAAIRNFKVPKYFFSSSVCIYRDMKIGEAELDEAGAYPAMPDNEYGWEKLYAERLALTFGRHGKTEVRIARFQNCYDDKTEILTDQGWKLFKNIQKANKIATRDSKGYMTFESPTEIQTIPYKGKMFLAQNKRIDLAVTPNHNVFASLRRNHLMAYIPIKDVWNKKNFFFSRKALWNGKTKDKFVLPSVCMEDGRSLKSSSKKIFPMKLWLKFMGYFLSEGSCFKVKNTDGTINGYRVVITQNPGKIADEIILTLKQLGYSPYITNEKEICITSKQLYNYCKQFGKAHDKYIPREFMDLDKSYLVELFKSLNQGDGDKNRGRYSSVSKRLADDVQELAIKLGYGAIVSLNKGEPIFRVLFNNETVHRISPEHKTEIDYDGIVYDVTVPNHVILVRRNGKSFWGGNCYGPEGTWQGGREKAPAAICRKVAMINGPKGTIEVWGDGTAVRSYTYVDDMVDGIVRLMKSNIKIPVNIGNPDYESVDELVKIVAEVAGKKVSIKHIKGPVGVQSRNFSNKQIYKTGWKAKNNLKKGIEQTYPWIEKQVNSNK
jgi:nucleoside-diphosphate-sugar epimerase